MEPLPGSQRFVTAWYSQGTKIVDYHIDEAGRWTFEEVASFTPLGVNANTWAVEPFKTVHGLNSVTYFFMASDIQRGIDIFSWTGPAGPRIGSIGRSSSGVSAGDVGLGGLVLVLLPAAALIGRRRLRAAGRRR
jgi:hypothetical protein